ncbi:DUF3185 family protein [Pseudomarimonas salicorniae]|uniref:DUF3185 family protein n=1 Tax=Pseudomarimonas salicorniae TaxID=2933270 RepID=A0ABT0GFT3_9GAMM|nr:DUF3185 family protein [Lysobacter sp. CAU 1642]MCK7593054.1 DUF3185 family protein [Lysobacter sp. CAU 1642]
MGTQRLLGLVLLVAGAVLLYFGLQSTESVSEKLVEGFTGRYSDGTMAYLVGGAIAGALGLALLLFGKRR